MITMHPINSKISRSFASEYKKTTVAFTKLLKADNSTGKTNSYPTINRMITTIAKSKIFDSELSNSKLVIEVYQNSDKLHLNKFSSVKAPSRFTVSWSAEKENLRVEERFL